jgi:hypothetical protein
LAGLNAGADSNTAEATEMPRGANLATQASILPTPNAGQFKIYVPATSESRYDITISDMTGRICYKSDAFTSNGALDHAVSLTGAAAGLYIIRLEGDSETLTTFTIIGQ